MRGVIRVAASHRLQPALLRSIGSAAAVVSAEAAAPAVESPSIPLPATAPMTPVTTPATPTASGPTADVDNQRLDATELVPPSALIEESCDVKESAPSPWTSPSEKAQHSERADVMTSPPQPVSVSATTPVPMPTPIKSSERSESEFHRLRIVVDRVSHLPEELVVTGDHEDDNTLSQSQRDDRDRLFFCVVEASITDGTSVSKLQSFFGSRFSEAHHTNFNLRNPPIFVIS
jgi:hypothetical protein